MNSLEPTADFLPRPTPEQRAEWERKRQEEQNASLAFHRLLSSPDGATVLGVLDQYMERQPEPGRNTDAQAWHYLGQQDICKYLRRRAAMGAELARRRGEVKA